MEKTLVHQFNRTWNKCVDVLRTYNTHWYVRTAVKLAIELNRTTTNIKEDDLMKAKIYGAAQTHEERLKRIDQTIKKEIERFWLLGYYVEIIPIIKEEEELFVRINLLG